MLKLWVGLFSKRNCTCVQDSILPHALGLRRLKLDVGLVDYESNPYNSVAPTSKEYSIAPIIRGVCAFEMCNSALKASLLHSAMTQGSVGCVLVNTTLMVIDYIDRAAVSAGLRSLVHLQSLTITMEITRSGPLLGMLEVYKWNCIFASYCI